MPDYTALAARERSDNQFVHWIEKTMPKGAAVFELPWVVFPEGPVFERIQMYDLLAGYLHSDTLRWSFGAMRGRPIAQWQQRVSAEITAAAGNATYSEQSAQVLRARLAGPLRTLVLAGFDGIYIDRDGYADSANALIAALAQTLQISPLMSPDLRLAFFNLTGSADTLIEGIPAAQLESMRAAAMPGCEK
jgi:phosphoglycerol transferase